jgi:hypothetical protein
MRSAMKANTLHQISGGGTKSILKCRSSYDNLTAIERGSDSDEISPVKGRGSSILLSLFGGGESAHNDGFRRVAKAVMVANRFFSLNPEPRTLYPESCTLYPVTCTLNA